MDACSGLDFSNNDSDDFVDTDFMEKKQIQCCSICNKDLSHLDSIRRSQHMNRCLDKNEVKGKAIRARNDFDHTRDCPLCFEPLAPGPHRVTHYKRCAKTHNVTAAEMNEMISHNDKVAQIRKRSGVSHTRAHQQSATEIERNLFTKLNQKNKIGPKNLSDEHLQTALALSMSENYSGDPFTYGTTDCGRVKLKQATIPTLLESTTSEMRLQVMQERLLQLILTPPVEKITVTEFGNNKLGNTNWELSRWWRVQACQLLEPSDYRIELLRTCQTSGNAILNFTTISEIGLSSANCESAVKRELKEQQG